jgi:hypothetical protein
LIEKKIPGKGWEYIVYNLLDQPVLTQDANQRVPSTNEWLFTKYDVLGRVIYTGIYKDNSNYTRLQMQSYFDSENNMADELYETKLCENFLNIYYSNSDFPTLNLEVLTVNYYDNYNCDFAGTGISVSNIYGQNSTSQLKGLTTGSLVKVLGTLDSWITTVVYYDNKARPIYTYSKK